MSVPMVEMSHWNIFEEALGQQIVCFFVYNFADIMKAYRKNQIKLENIPGDFPLKSLERYKTNNIDFRTERDGCALKDGLSFTHIGYLMKANMDELKTVDLCNGRVLDILIGGKPVSRNTEQEFSHQIFLSSYRCLCQEEKCVYMIVKDRNRKVITIAFRGSRPLTKDMKYNLNVFCKEMKTPKLLRNKLDGPLKENVLVHCGFKDYLFHNNDNEYKNICTEIENLIKGEEGYRIYVTGHSLGAALASLMAFKIAGSRRNIPRPITLITFASPRVGTAGFRTAFEQLEKDGLLRCLRFSVNRDPICATPSVSIPGWIRKDGDSGETGRFTCRPFKHVGLNIRLCNNSCEIVHSSNVGLVNAIRNNSILPIFFFVPMAWISTGDPFHYHANEFYLKRFLVKHNNILQKWTMDDLYRDENIVSKAFSQEYAARTKKAL